MRRRSVVAAAALAVVVVTAVAAVVIVPRGSGCPETAPSPFPTQPLHHDPELEARIPDSVAGQRLDVQTYCASTSSDGGLNTAPEFLAALGVKQVDVTVARSAGPEIGESDRFTHVDAWRYRGVAEDVLRETFLEMYVQYANDAGIDAGYTEMRVGGKTVHDLDIGGSVYVAGDTIYIVGGTDVGELLAGLP